MDEAMNDIQILTIVLASAPTMLTVLIGILINNSRLNDVNARISEIRAEMVTKAELRRMEEVIDARLKHLEER